MNADISNANGFQSTMINNWIITVLTNVSFFLLELSFPFRSLTKNWEFILQYLKIFRLPTFPIFVCHLRDIRIGIISGIFSILTESYTEKKATLYNFIEYIVYNFLIFVTDIHISCNISVFHFYLFLFSSNRLY